MQRIEEAPIEYRRSLEAFVARHLFDFYKGLERIFQRIAREVDRTLPSAEEWHKDLLQQMTESSANIRAFSRNRFRFAMKLMNWI